MTEAQRKYLVTNDIDPWSLEWNSAKELGFPKLGRSEAARLPDGRVLLANGEALPRPDEDDPNEGLSEEFEAGIFDDIARGRHA